MNPQILFGRVVHVRKRPVRHAMAYPVFFLRVPLSAVGKLAGPLFGVDRFNLFSFMTRDFGARDGSPIEPWARRLLKQAAITTADGEIVLQAFPRMLGYVFNPIAVYYCHDREGGLRAAICAVANTFGEHHNYVVAHSDGRVIAPGDRLTARKAFHVSPFCEVTGHYRFRFAGTEEAQRTQIDYHDPDGLLLVTAIQGRARALGTALLARTFFAYPMMTLAVIARIHWHALLLWAKRVPWFSKPQPPLQETTR